MTTATSPASTDILTFGAVELRVTDIDRSAEFWERLIGLTPMEDRDGARTLGSDGQPLIMLRQTATRPAEAGRSGLYHVAIHYPTTREFGRVLARLATARWPFGTTDHLFSQSFYLRDPDGIGVELARETPWRMSDMRVDAEHGLHAVDQDGNVHRSSEPLDLEPFVAEIEGADIAAPAEGAYVGHVHLAVPDLVSANAFYRDQLGLTEHVNEPSVGLADLNAGGPFTHRIALNTFYGPGVRPTPADMAGMDRFTIRYDGQERLDRTVARVGGSEVHDPAGNAIELIA